MGLHFDRLLAITDGVASFHGGLVPLTGDTTIPADIAVQVHTGASGQKGIILCFASGALLTQWYALQAISIRSPRTTSTT